MHKESIFHFIPLPHDLYAVFAYAGDGDDPPGWHVERCGASYLQVEQWWCKDRGWVTSAWADGVSLDHNAGPGPESEVGGFHCYKRGDESAYPFGYSGTVEQWHAASRARPDVREMERREAADHLASIEESERRRRLKVAAPKTNT